MNFNVEKCNLLLKDPPAPTRGSGYYEFMVSPYYVEFGENKKARLDEWNRRWAEHWKRLARRKSRPPT